MCCATQWFTARPSIYIRANRLFLLGNRTIGWLMLRANQCFIHPNYFWEFSWFPLKIKGRFPSIFILSLIYGAGGCWAPFIDGFLPLPSPPLPSPPPPPPPLPSPPPLPLLPLPFLMIMKARLEIDLKVLRVKTWDKGGGNGGTWVMVEVLA